MVKNIQKYKVFLIFLITYFSCDSFILTLKYKDYSTLIMVAVICVCVLVSLFKGQYSILSNVWGILIFAGINICITTLFNGYMNGYMLLILEIVLAIALIHLYTKDEFFESYIFIIKILSVYAIVIGLINIIIPSLLGGFSTFTSSNYNTYYDAIFSFQLSNTPRINSIWGEPGMFAVFLNFAIIFECFYVNRPIHYANLAILIVAEFLTFSSAGYVCLVLIMLAYFLSSNKSSSERKTALIILLVAVLFYVIMKNVPWIKEMTQGSINKLTDTDNISFIGRLAPILYNLSEGFKSFFWGHGIDSQKFNVDFSFYKGTLYCNTSTTTYLFYAFGIIISAITVYLTWKLAGISRKSGKVFKFILFIALLINVNAQLVYLDQLYWIILFVPYMWDDDLLNVDELNAS